jgi:uncharacterized protein (DUF58 family)
MNARVTISLEELIRLKAEARGFSFLPRQPVHSLLAGRHASRLRGRGLSFEELRRYADGDDIRTMDWRATARLRKPHVRVYSEERERPVLLVVDQRTPMFFGSRRAMKSVAAAEVAALAAWRALASGDRVGAVIFGDAELTELSPHRSQTRVLRVLHEIVRFNQMLTQPATAGRKVTLNAALETAVRRARHDHLVVLISDLDGADEETQRLATTLAAHNDVLVVAVYDPLGATLAPTAGMFATDGLRTVVLPESADFPPAFQRVFTELLAHWQQIFRALRIPVLPVSTATAPVDQLREFFGAHLHPAAGA